MRPVLLVITCSVLALIAVILLVFWRNPVTAQLGDEVFKLVVQFLLIVVLGGAVSFAYKGFQREQEKRNTDKQLWREFHDNLLRAYNEVKKVRRLLRAHAIRPVARMPATDDPDYDVIGSAYDEQMQVLMESQLQIEFLDRQVKNDPDLYSSTENLRDGTKPMKQYLHTVLSEYQRSFAKFSGDPATFPLSKLPKLKEFIGPFEETPKYWNSYIKPFYYAEQCLQQLIRR